jgi:hypothetical protein
MFAEKVLSKDQEKLRLLQTGEPEHSECQLPQALAEEGKLIQSFLCRLKASKG